MYSKIKSFSKYIFIIALLCVAFTTHAATGTIDPLSYTAQVCESTPCTVSSTSPVNFGYFSTSPASNVTITDSEMTGYIWGTSFGWVVLNCANTTSGCSSTNGNFKVANTINGALSGYAWGQGAGWVNFGPFSNGTNSVVINSLGEFNGYAWAQNYGWIKFDCSAPSYCVKTTWRPATSGSTGGGGSGGGYALCMDSTATNYQGRAPCTYPQTICNDTTATNFGGALPCRYPVSQICLDTSATNYNGTLPCTYPQSYALCLDRTAANYNGRAPCTYPQALCIDRTAINVGEALPCTYPQTICNDTTATNFGGALPCIPAIMILCLDRSASNYNAQGPCAYPQNTSLCNDSTALNVGSRLPCQYPVTFTYCATHPTDKNCITKSVTAFATILQTVKTPLLDFMKTTIAPISAVTVLALGLLTSVATSPFANILLVPLRLWGLLFITKRYRPWGVVYDSVTKQPLDPVYVTLQDLQGNELMTSITDLDGRYGFLVSAGQYKMTAHKTNYEFPSQKLKGTENDEIYTDLYFDQIITVKEEGDVILKNIPMDPLATDWNEAAKRDQGLMKFYSKNDIWITRLSNILFYLGFLMTTLALFITPNVYNAVIFSIYVIVSIFKNTFLRSRPFGRVVDTGRREGLAHALVHVYAAGINQEVSKKVTNETGRYYCILPNGIYYVKIDRRNSDGSYISVYTSDTIKVKNGYLHTKFKI